MQHIMYTSSRVHTYRALRLRLPIPLTPAEALRVVREQSWSTLDRVFFISSLPLERLHGTPWKLYGSASAALAAAAKRCQCVHSVTLAELIAHADRQHRKRRYACRNVPGRFKSIGALRAATDAAGVNIDDVNIAEVWV